MPAYTTPDTLLVDRQTGARIEVGQTVFDFRGDPLVVLGWRVGSHPGSTGRVLVTDPGETSAHAREYFPSVVNARVIPA